MDNEKLVWIGLVSVTPQEGNRDLADSTGAVVNVLSLADSPEDFNKNVHEKMNEFGFDVDEIEDIKIFNFSPNIKYKDNLRKLANEVKKDKALRWGTFYTYK
jgi:hypothetical protein